MHNLRLTGVSTVAAGEESTTVVCEFVVGCGLDMSTAGDEGTELSSTVGNRAVPLDSSEMLLQTRRQKV